MRHYFEIETTLFTGNRETITGSAEDYARWATPTL